MKVGDKVRIVRRLSDNDTGGGRRGLGMVGVITEEFAGDFVVWNLDRVHYYGIFEEGTEIQIYEGEGMEFKAGDKVIITANTNYHGFKIGETVRLVTHDEGKSWRATKLDGSDSWYVMESEMKPVSQYRVGQVFTKDGEEFKLLAEVDGVFATSEVDDFSRVENWATESQIDEYVKNGWKVKGEKPEVTELTIEEIAKKFDVSPEQVRIKKESVETECSCC